MRPGPVLSAGALVALASVVLLPPESSQSGPSAASAVVQTGAAASPCLVCHEGLEDIRDPASGMMLQFSDLGTVARTCESCHSDPKALGYGIQDGRYQQRYPEDIVVDLEFPDGAIWPDQAQIQIAAIPELDIDFSQIVTREGTQLQIVGSHWPDSRPLDQDQRERMERTGVCMGCHRNMATPTFWDQKVVAKYGVVVTDDEHINMMERVLTDAAAVRPPEREIWTGWYVVGAILALGLALGAFGKPLVELTRSREQE